MQLLIVSDIHGNLAAFRAVLEATEGQRDRVICLGDLVGYGPDPNECVELAREVCDLILGGNHDLGVSGRIGRDRFSPHAATALEWTGRVIKDANRRFLETLAVRAEFTDGESAILLSHGGPEDPVWSYILTREDAAYSFRMNEFSRCFFGHTHVPSVCIARTGRSDACSAAYGKRGKLIRTNRPDRRFLLNPGRVGFPRYSPEDQNRDPWRAVARYALYDTTSGFWHFLGAEYDGQDTADRMAAAGL
jgi:predicted phosphodiesterase